MGVKGERLRKLQAVIIDGVPEAAFGFGGFV